MIEEDRRRFQEVGGYRKLAEAMTGRPWKPKLILETQHMEQVAALAIQIDAYRTAYHSLRERIADAIEQAAGIDELDDVNAMDDIQLTFKQCADIARGIELEEDPDPE